MKKLLMAATVAVAAMASATTNTAHAVAITVQFNVAALGAFVANTGDVTTATSVSGGAPYIVGAVQQDNIGVVTSLAVVISDPVPLVVGSVFSKTFTTALGTFVETLTVNSVTPTANSVGMLASGTIAQTVGVGFDPTPVFWSVSYTQNQGPGSQINGSINDSTTFIPLQTPEPASLALLGVGLMGLGLARRARRR